LNKNEDIMKEIILLIILALAALTTTAQDKLIRVVSLVQEPM